MVIDTVVYWKQLEWHFPTYDIAVDHMKKILKDSDVNWCIIVVSIVDEFGVWVSRKDVLKHVIDDSYSVIKIDNVFNY